MSLRRVGILLLAGLVAFTTVYTLGAWGFLFSLWLFATGLTVAVVMAHGR